MLEDIRTCRATTFLGASWVLVFAAMHLFQWFGITAGAPPGSQVLGFGQVGVETAHIFGALRWNDVIRGEAWRLVTATFIHFNVLHLLMNLVGLMQLGWLMEPWYGSRQFLAILLAIGGLGNLFGGLLRQAFYYLRAWIEGSGMGRLLPDFLRNGGAPGLSIPVTSGGGSTIILGMIGLAMVVGWRSKTRVGMFLRDQMLGFLGFTALLGIVLAKLVDNYGHLGGTIAGVGFGYLHRKLVRTAEDGWARRLIGMAAVGTLLVCASAQAIVATRTLERGRLQTMLLSERTHLLHRGQTTVEVLTLLERIDKALVQGALLNDPVGIGEIDWPEPLGRVAPTPPPVPPKVANARHQARLQIKNYLATLAAARQTLDADLAGESLDELVTIAEHAATGPISVREFYNFQAIGSGLVKKIQGRQKHISTRVEEVTKALAENAK